jgi:riboflavin kinase/FMN adenylyltransferase
MPLANEYLGYDYFYLELFSKESNLVEPLGSTANIKIEEDYKLIPHNGVYVVKSIKKKPFWNDEHRVQPHCIGRETVDRSPF